MAFAGARPRNTTSRTGGRDQSRSKGRVNWNRFRIDFKNGGSMKSILKGVAIFAFGLAIGGGITGYVVKRVYEYRLNWVRAGFLGADVVLAHNLRGEDGARIVL